MSQLQPEINDISNHESNQGCDAEELGVWGKVTAKLSEYISEDAFSRWFKNAELIEAEGKKGLVRCAWWRLIRSLLTLLLRVV